MIEKEKMITGDTEPDARRVENSSNNNRRMGRAIDRRKGRQRKG